MMDSDEIISFWHLARSESGDISSGIELSAYWADAGNTDVKLVNISKCYKVKPRLLHVTDLSAEMAVAKRSRAFSTADEEGVEEAGSFDFTASDTPLKRAPLSAERGPRMEFSRDDSFLQVICNGQQILLSLKALNGSQTEEEASPTDTTASSHEGFFSIRMHEWMEEKSSLDEED